VIRRESLQAVGPKTYLGWRDLFGWP